MLVGAYGGGSDEFVSSSGKGSGPAAGSVSVSVLCSCTACTFVSWMKTKRRRGRKMRARVELSGPDSMFVGPEWKESKKLMEKKKAEESRRELEA